MELFSLQKIAVTSTILLWFLSVEVVSSIRDVRVKIPHAVLRGDKAVLKCLYELDEDDILYSVKWYRGRREFYSFTPKETPAMKTYPVPGIKVDRSSSNESQLVLDSVNLATTGKYSCEVSADAPSFHTLIGAGELEVVEVPGKDPIITGIRPRYRIGDIVRGNCTLRHTKPAANLTWTINGYETNPSHIRHHKPIKDTRDMETAISGIHFVVTPQHFIYGKLKLRCTAHIHDIYWKATEKSIEEDRHRHSSGNNINLVNTFSEDYFDLEDGNLIDRSDTYMTHIKGDASSLNAGAAASQHTKVGMLPSLVTLMLLLHAMLQILQLCRQLFKQTIIALPKDETRKNSTSSSSSSNSRRNKLELQRLLTAVLLTKGGNPKGRTSVTKISASSNSTMKMAKNTQQQPAQKGHSLAQKSVQQQQQQEREEQQQQIKANQMRNEMKIIRNVLLIKRESSQKQLLQGQLLQTAMERRQQKQQQPATTTITISTLLAIVLSSSSSSPSLPSALCWHWRWRWCWWCCHST